MCLTFSPSGFNLASILEFLLLFEVPDPEARQCERLTQTALSSGAPGFLASHSPGWLVGEVSSVGGAGDAWRRLAVGACRPLGLGCGVSTPRRGTADAQCSPRAEKVVVHTCTPQHATPRAYSARTAACAHGTHV